MAGQTGVAIGVRGITKSFRIPLDGKTGIKQRVIGMFKHKKGYRDFKPLDDVSFEIEKGDFFGIVGRNGSGKSTLLKLIAGIYTPDKGSVKVNGLLIPFIELGVGFNPELSGRENVYLNAALLGFSRKETTALYDEIVDFAELHNFMEEKLKNYSSGMQVRLAFSIAIQAKGDILLLDEVLAVGDAAFQQKCYDYFEKIKSEEKTIILVTHSMDIVKRFCNKALLLHDGAIKMIGKPEEIADQYLVDNISSKSSKAKNNSTLVDHLSAFVEKNEYSRAEDLKIKYTYKLKKSLAVVLGMSIIKDGRSVAEVNSLSIELDGSSETTHYAELQFPLNALNPGEYSINISIFSRETMKMMDYVIKAHIFVVSGNDQTRGGPLYLDAKWK